FGDVQKGHGIAFGDLDNDGDQDILAVFGGVYPGDLHQRVLFENPGHGNHWISLKLEGVRSNRAAIGARITVNVQTMTGSRNVYSSVSTGGSFGCSPLRQQIGLGQARAINSVKITWPATMQTQVFKNLGMDQLIKIREGEADPTIVSVRPFKLGGSPSQRELAPQILNGPVTTH